MGRRRPESQSRMKGGRMRNNGILLLLLCAASAAAQSTPPFTTPDTAELKCQVMDVPTRYGDAVSTRQYLFRTRGVWYQAAFDSLGAPKNVSENRMLRD